MESWKHLVKKGEIEELSLAEQDIMFGELFLKYLNLNRDLCFGNKLLEKDQQDFDLSCEFKEEFRKHCIVLRLKKGALMNLYKKKECIHIVTVKGLIAARTQYRKIDDVPFFMGESNSLMCEEEFFMFIKSDLDIVALEDSDCIFINMQEVDLLKKKYHEVMMILVKAARLSMIKLHKRKELWRLSAEEKYNRMYTENPTFTSRLPATELAMHLGLDEYDIWAIRNVVRSWN